MRYLIVSDLHGSSYGARKIVDIAKKVKPDVLLMLGDMLHGAMDDDAMFAANTLKSLPCGMLGVKGNCDYPSDEKLLGITLPNYRQIPFGNDLHTIYLSHHPVGVPLPPGDIFMHGHTHRKRLESIRGAIYFNPGSIALPRDDGPGYGVFEDKKLQLFDALKGTLIQEIVLD